LRRGTDMPLMQAATLLHSIAQRACGRKRSMNLDTLVAEAMGYQPGNIDCDYEHYCVRECGVLLNSVLLFSPSTNITHAHMFRDKVLGEHRDWFVMTGYKNGDNHTIHVLADGNAHEIGVAEEPIEPTALCLALLRACGVPEEKIKEAMDGQA